ncbi:hypothetical protein ACK3TF_003758 [Chlorella vulgaris]
MSRHQPASLTGLEVVALVIVFAALCRAVAQPKVDTSLLAAMLALTTCVATGLATSLFAPRWHARHGSATAVLLRLSVIGLSALPGVAASAWLRQGANTSCSLFLWRWLLSSVASPALLTCLAWALPSRPALAVVALHQVLLARTAAEQCGVRLAAIPAIPANGAALLQLDPGCCLDAAAPGLDWPLYFVAPEGMLLWGGLSHQAACLAMTLWAQSALEALLPWMLLLGLDARRGALVARAQEPDVSCAASQAARHRGEGWAVAAWAGVALCVTDMPVSSAAFALQMLWMLLRTACMHVSPM